MTTRYRQENSVDGRKTTAQRAMVEKALGAKLPSDVVVHHQDEDKLNNSMSNFSLLTSREHGLLHNPPIKSVTTACLICETIFTPHKTKRERTATCSAACKSDLLRLRWSQRRARA